MDISDTKEYVRTTLQNEAEPLWFPRLAEPVTRLAWEHLHREIGLNPNSYSTTRLLLRDPNAEYEIAAYCKPRSEQKEDGTPGEIPVESLAADLVRQLTDSEVQLLDSCSIAGIVTHQLNEALSLLDIVPSVLPTVCQLVRALHVIDPGDTDTDVSFSDPAVPFSIFVSVPPTASETGTLRVAEAILHEAMHLHLTLIAKIVPLVEPRGRMRYSPWRGEERDSEGIIQALYVFSVIRSFLAMLPRTQSHEFGDHASDRMQQIDSQIRQAKDFRGCEELTAHGAALVARLLDNFE